jgi:phage shock protein PspC (stress-responsive transcriptional regulator)
MIMNKRLYRGKGYIGGVCEGLGEWSGIPSILWRILAIFLASLPTTIVIYILLWIFVEPKK